MVSAACGMAAAHGAAPAHMRGRIRWPQPIWHSSVSGDMPSVVRNPRVAVAHAAAAVYSAAATRGVVAVLAANKVAAFHRGKSATTPWRGRNLRSDRNTTHGVAATSGCRQPMVPATSGAVAAADAVAQHVGWRHRIPRWASCHGVAWRQPVVRICQAARSEDGQGPHGQRDGPPAVAPNPLAT